MPDCSKCNKIVLESKNEPVPFTAHELDMARLERSNKRNFILCVLLIAALVASWIGFITYESQFETVSDSTQTVWQETDGGGSNFTRFVGGDDYGSETVREDDD